MLHGAFQFGSKELSAPQAGLMAALAQGIVGKEMAWPLVIVGMLMGFAFILVQIKSPMLVAVGMYLPLETTFAIFCGGMIKGIVDRMANRRSLNPAQKTRVENVGILLASGLIAGEALTGLVRATWKFMFFQKVVGTDIPEIFKQRQLLCRVGSPGADRRLSRLLPAPPRRQGRRAAAALGRRIARDRDSKAADFPGERNRPRPILRSGQS